MSDSLEDRISDMQQEIARLKAKVSSIPQQTSEVVRKALREHEQRERRDADPNVIADQVMSRLWISILGEDMASSPEAAKYKRSLQEMWRTVIQASPYVFRWKMSLLILVLSVLALSIGADLMSALRSKIGL
jgi:hypothetical protein